nr:hypothetical protein [Roseomonas sp. FDAARGOS_362]
MNDPVPVLQAIEEHDRLGEEAFLEKYGYGPARSYWLLHDGRRYASKAILGVAFGYRFPGARPLKASEFAGGESTVRRALTRLGFTVEVDDKAATAVVLPVLASGDADTTAFDPEGMVDAREKILREIRLGEARRPFAIICLRRMARAVRSVDAAHWMCWKRLTSCLTGARPLTILPTVCCFARTSIPCSTAAFSRLTRIPCRCWFPRPSWSRPIARCMVAS